MGMSSKGPARASAGLTKVTGYFGTVIWCFWICVSCGFFALLFRLVLLVWRGVEVGESLLTLASSACLR